MLSHFQGWELPGRFMGLSDTRVPSPVPRPFTPLGAGTGCCPVSQDRAASSQGAANGGASPCVIWGKKSQYFQRHSLHLPIFHLPRQFPILESQPGLGDPRTDHAGKLMQSSPPPRPKPLEKHFPPEIGPERMSANKAPFIAAGTAAGDTRGLPALCASACACAPWPRPGKGRRFSSFYPLLGFSPFRLLRVTSCPSLPPSPPSHLRGRWLRWAALGSPGPLPPPIQPCPGFRVTVLREKASCPCPSRTSSRTRQLAAEDQGGFGV